MSGIDPNRAGVIVVGGGGSSLPTATGAGEIPVSTGAGTTYAATGAAGVRTTLSIEDRYDTVAAGPWTLVSPSGGGTAAISGGDLVLTQPGSPSTTGDAGRAQGYVSTGADPCLFDVRVRLVSLAGANVNTQPTLLITSSTGTMELRLWCEYDGTIRVGALQPGWTGNLASSSANAVNRTNGTAWLRLLVQGKRIAAFYGTGSGTTAPVGWTSLYEGVLTPGEPLSWDRAGLCLTQHIAGTGSTVTATWDSLRVVNLGSAP